MRNFIDIISAYADRILNETETINEFQKADTGGQLPPLKIEPDEGSGGGGQDGKYWVSERGKVIVPMGSMFSDYANQVFITPEKFGFTWDEVLAATEHNEFVHSILVDWNNEGRTKYFHNASMLRTLGQRFLFSRGWVLVDYYPPHGATIIGDKANLKSDVAHVLDQFALMQVDQIKVLLDDAADEKGMAPRLGKTFSRADNTGFGGCVSAMMKWLSSL